MILESKKVPLTDKVIIQEHDVLTVINKIRLVLNSQDDIINQKIQVNQSRRLSLIQIEIILCQLKKH